MSCLYYSRPQRRRESLSEFLEPDDGEYDANRPFYNGHHRYIPLQKVELNISTRRQLTFQLWRTKKGYEDLHFINTEGSNLIQGRSKQRKYLHSASKRVLWQPSVSARSMSFRSSSIFITHITWNEIHIVKRAVLTRHCAEKSSQEYHVTRSSCSSIFREHLTTEIVG